MFSDISRRDALRRLGLALIAAGTVDRLSAEEIHHFAGTGQAAASPYTPKTLTPAEARTNPCPSRPSSSGRSSG